MSHFDTVQLSKSKPWALNETILDVNKSAWHGVFHQFRNRTLAILAGGIIWFVIFYLLSGQSGYGFSFFSFLQILPVFVLLIYIYNIFVNARHEFYRQFANANGMVYSQKAQLTNLQGALFNLGHGHKTEDAISGTYDGNRFNLFTYQYTIGSGKSQQTYGCTVAQINYPSVLPSILLIVDSQYFGGIVPFFSGWEKLRPALTFDRNFDLYGKKEFEIETLQIFTPDVMEKLLNAWPQFNLEFNHNTLYVFCAHTILTKAELQKMYELTQYLIAKIEPVAIRMKSSLRAMEAMR